VALTDPLTFKGIANANHDQYNENLLWGLIDWLKWAGLNIGAYQNISIGQSSGILGGVYARLRPVKDPRYTDGRVWEGFKEDWVWETGIPFSPSPIIASGVNVDGAFYPTPSTGSDYEHYIDYTHGRVVFANTVSTSSVIKANFSYRTMSFTPAHTPFFRELMYESHRIDRNDYLQMGSGAWGQISNIRRSLPVIGVEIVPHRTYRPYQLGGGQWVEQSVVLHIMADNDFEKNQWIDILSMQNDKTVYLINRKRLKESGNYPYDLDYRGVPVNNPTQYPLLTQPTGDGGYRWTKGYISDAIGQSLDPINGWLYRGMVTFTTTIILPGI